MALQPGTKIGTFEIIELLGSGGMGEVYRGIDRKLNRPVAIKFLSEEMTDPASRRRFEREAEMVSSLNHPHILTVYAVGEFETDQYLVAELVDGGTLQDWSRTQAPTWQQAVGLLAGIADGLAAAHAAGILHRDLKPANILVARNGYAKLADFGLAKPLQTSADEATIESHPTRAGVVVGTIAYMSPEQAAGKPLDARSDIFSFGVVLYEAVTGRRPFGGTTNLELLQSISHGTPEPLPPNLPVALRLTIEKALENDPADRYQSMRDLVVDLRRLLRQRASDSRAFEMTAPARPRWPAMAIAGTALGVVIAGAAAMWFYRARPEDIANPLEHATFTRFTNFEGTERSAAISPDGHFVAFRSDREGPLDVWLGQVETGRFVNLTKGIDDEFSTDTPSSGFSRDGSEIWLSGGGDRRLRLIPMLGGTPRPFLAEKAVSVAWSPDGSRVVYHLQDDGDSMYIADRTGANARLLFRRNINEHNHFPIWSTDGRWIYFSSGTPVTKEMDVWRIPVEGGTPERLTEHNSDVGSITALDVHTILYVSHDRDGAGPWLWALDVDRKVARRVSFGVEKYTSVAATPDGRHLAASVSNPTAHLWTLPILSDRVAEESDVRPFVLTTADASAPQMAGGSLFYLSSLGTGDGVWRFDGDQSTEIWKGRDGAVLAAPAASHDGRKIAAVMRRDKELRLHVLSADGGELQTLAPSIDMRGGASWSADGKWIVVAGSEGGKPGLFKIPTEGGPPVRLLTGPALNPVWSPDGNLIVYAGPNVSAFAPLKAVRADGTAVDMPPIQIRRDGERVRFLPDGTGLIYMQGLVRAQNFWLLDLRTMKSRALTKLTSRDAMNTFDVFPDGKRIVFDRLRDNSDIVLIDLPKNATQ